MKKKIYIIAEAGVNHNGNMDIARKMIDAAAAAQADAVKFQTFRAVNLLCPSAPKAAYQMQTTHPEESQWDMIKALELLPSDHPILLQHCRAAGITFLSSPFDLPSIALLAGLGLDIYKIPSGEITNLPYLRQVGQLGKRVILSTGMATLAETAAAIDVLTQAGTKRDDITALHCTTEYPTPYGQVNLKAMLTLKEKLGVAVGYSDHTLGIEVAVAAAALGATVIEKHFTLDRTMPGPDHPASLEPQDLRRLVEAVRNIELSLGDGIKRMSAVEEKNVTVVRKSIVAAQKIIRGEVFTAENLTTKRPGTGLNPMRWDQVIGRTAKRDFQPDELIEL
ncbi:MAG: N-acetylneuraminate synthase [Candidatus Omnitrophica bacterium]|nr:N-acetylneuraminate synthase [Candidatus Omnitrophota bacterium]